MKTLAPALVIALIAAHVCALDTTPWQFQQTITIDSTGLKRLDVPLETISAARPQLADLRLISPAGIETPFVIEWPMLTSAGEIPVKSFKASIVDQSTTLEIETGTTEALEAITLETPATSFIKAARIEGSADAVKWVPLAENEVLFRQDGGTSRLRIPFTAAPMMALRITIDDARSVPVPFTAARVTLAKKSPPTVTLPVTIEQREEKPQQTRLTVDLGGENLHLASLRLSAGEAVFSRRVTASHLHEDSGRTIESFIGSADIYRITRDGISTASLEIPLNRAVLARKIIITVQNGDSPPLSVTGVEAQRHPVSLVFYAQEAGAWKLFSGNRTAAAPHYDLATLQQDLRKSNATALKSSALITNAEFKVPQTLPEVQPEGANIDLAKWRYRKSITTLPGVVRVELDAEILAHAQTSLADLRVIQHEKQIPFLIDHTHASRSVTPTVAKEDDPKRRTVSQWRVTMQLDGLPVSHLTCTSATPLFDRSIAVWAKAKDQLGNEYRTHLGSAHWTRQAGDHDAKFTLALSSARLPSQFFIETDNGDNPPIEIADVQLHHAVIALVAKLQDNAPVFLYYGNESAYAPRYDLQLVRADLLSAQMQGATLNAEEVLRAVKKPLGEDSGTGSPWLWAGLAVVIVSLLWVVSRLLPNSPKPE